MNYLEARNKLIESGYKVEIYGAIMELRKPGTIGCDVIKITGDKVSERRVKMFINRMKT